MQECAVILSGMSGISKPMKTLPLLIRERGVTVKIYEATRRKKTKSGNSRRYKEFTIAYYLGNERRRETFSDLSLAKARAHEIAVSILQGRSSVLELTNSDKDFYLHALKLLKPVDVPLHIAVEEYVAARSRLDGESLLTTAKEYAQRHQHCDKPVGEIVDELLASKGRDGLSLRYIQSLRGHLKNGFAQVFHTNIGSITASMIEEW